MNSLYMKSRLVQAALGFVPPLIRENLLEKPSFRAQYGFKLDTVLTFVEAGISVKRSDLYNMIRTILSGTPTMEISDSNGQKWELKNLGGDGELPRLALSREGRSFILPNLAILSSDRSVRLNSFDRAASDINLPDSVRDVWNNIIVERALDDDEVDELQAEFRDTPAENARAIQNEIRAGRELSIASLVPSSRRYYERLVGAYDGSTSVHDYAANVARKTLEQLSTWRPYEGFLLSLLLSAHSSITAEIKVDQLDSNNLIRAFTFLDQQGDRISQLGAIELGFRILPLSPEIQPVLIRLVKRIRDDEIDGKASGFKLLSALFLLVDGELSRVRLLSAEPPFYRRLAALSQAALIYRQIDRSGIDADHFFEWSMNNRGAFYYTQSFVDMRLEPRWEPDYGMPSQLKADFFGRIMNAAKKYEQNIKDRDLSDLVLGTQPGSLSSLNDSFHPYLPGPLEGAEEPHRLLPAEFAEAIETQLTAKDVEPSSFFALINSALIFRIGTDQAELAAKALSRGNYRLTNIVDMRQLLVLLNGLATVAAVTRSSVLSGELRILLRRYRRDAQYVVSIEDTIRICLIAAASHSDTVKWRDFVGDWLTELSLGELHGNEGEILHANLDHLCHVVPQLWISCGRADAALMAYNASKQTT